MANVCNNQTTPAYAQQRAAYAKAKGHKNIKEVVKEKLLANWTDGDCSDDTVLNLSGLEKENITLSDVAAAIGDIFDEKDQFNLNFDYEGTTNMWALVDQLKEVNGEDCDVRELDEIKLHTMTGECRDKQAVETLGSNEIDRKIFGDRQVLEALKQKATDSGHNGFHFDQIGDFNKVKQALDEILNQFHPLEHDLAYNLNDETVTDICNRFDNITPNKSVHSLVKNNDGWLGLGEIQGALDQLEAARRGPTFSRTHNPEGAASLQFTESETVRELTDEQIQTLVSDPHFIKIVENKLQKRIDEGTSDCRTVDDCAYKVDD